MDLFLSFALTVTLAAMIAAFIGTRLPKTHRAASRIRLNAAPDTVWRIITEVERYPEWRPGLDRVERGPDIAGLPSWYEVCGRLARVQFRIAASEPPSRLVTQIVGDRLPLSGTWIYHLEADGAGTCLTLTEWENIHHPLLRFFDHFVLRYHGVMDVYLTALALHLGDPALPEHLSLKLDPADAALPPL